MEQFEQIAVKTQGNPGGAVTRIRDVGRVELGAQTYSQFLDMDGQPAAGIAVFQLPDANALDVGQAVEAEMKRLSTSFPSGIAYSVPFDTTRFVRASIDEVYKTLIEAAVLVLLVIIVFLQSWRATLVPATTVPVTIIGAFAAMAALGFSVNLLTLFALVLAIGIVVDDAIIVVEGSAKYVEKGIEPRQAATLAMNELLRPILAITLVLLTMFLPASILPGIVGQLYRQFALVIAATAVISAINAVTLKPTQCAQWLRPQTGRPNAFYRGFNRVYDRIENGYAALMRRLVRFPVGVSLVAVALAGLAIWSLTRLPTAFIPAEDQGYLLVGTQLPVGASLEPDGQKVTRVGTIALRPASST